MVNQALNVIQELDKLSSYNLTKVLGALLLFCDVGYRIPHEREHFLFATVFFMIGELWQLWGIFYSWCFVFRETAIEQESLQAVQSFLTITFGCDLWPSHPRFI